MKNSLESEENASAPLSSAQIMEKARQNYAAFSSYQGSCCVVSDSLLALGEGALRQYVSSASAKIDFVRDERLSVEGVDTDGELFRAQWTPGESYVERLRHRKGQKWGELGELTRVDDRDKINSRAIDSMTARLSGFTGGVGSQIADALMPGKFNFGNPFLSPGLAGKFPLKSLPAEQLGSKNCHVIELKVPSLERVITYWIECDTFLLRRLTKAIGAQNYDDAPEIEGRKLPMLHSAYSLSQFVFATTEAK